MQYSGSVLSLIVVSQSRHLHAMCSIQGHFTVRVLDKELLCCVCVGHAVILILLKHETKQKFDTAALTNHFLMFTMVQRRRSGGTRGDKSQTISLLYNGFSSAFVLLSKRESHSSFYQTKTLSERASGRSLSFPFFLKKLFGYGRNVPCVQKQLDQKKVKDLQLSSEFTSLLKHLPAVIY